MSLYEFFFGFTEETKRKHPHLFVADQIDRRGAKRTTPMQVLNLSMGRTGTASMKAALEQLGYSTSHGFDLHENPQDGWLWQEAMEAKCFNNNPNNIDLNRPEFWDQLLGHRNATTGLPANMFGPELIRAYPQAKILLVEREIEAWYKSFEQAIIKGADLLPVVHAFEFLEGTGKGYAIDPVVFKGCMKGQFRAKDSREWRENARETYARHYEEIREVVRERGEERRLLEYKLGSGWEPLCEFLGREVPKVPFPRVNETAAHDDMLRVVAVQMIRAVVWNIGRWTMPVVVALMAWRYSI